MKMEQEFFWIGTILGFVFGIAVLFLFLLNASNTPICSNEERIKLDCGRGLAMSCPNVCYDEATDSLFRFEHTDTNLNIIIEISDQQSVISMPGFVVEEYWEEDGYYYADIDDIQIIE